MTIAEISQKIDKIYVTEKECKKIFEWGKNNLVIDYDDPNYDPSEKLINKRMFFPLKTFVIELHMPKNTVIKALVELDTFNPVTSGRITTDNYWFTYKRDFERQGFDFDGEGAPESIVRTTHAFIIETLIYICFAKRNIEYKPMIDRAAEHGDDNPYEYQNRVCFLLNDIIQYVGTHTTRKSIQYQCECWGVRGHIRHYSDGRTVFIEPYKKGRLRDTLEPKSKTYLLKAEDLKND